MDIKQFQIVLVNLDPTLGSEVKKTRPCVVLSPNAMNRNIRTIIIAPITSNQRIYPTRSEINGKFTKGVVMIDQIKTVDKQRVLKIFESISENEIQKIKEIIKATFVD